jgi:iron(III) transport system substrate-binding protein
MNCSIALPGYLAALLAAAPVLSPAARADMPPSARTIVADLKVGADVLAGWEDEQKVPDAWLAGARKTGQLKIIGTWTASEFAKMAKPFFERYPFIKVDYVRGSSNTRTQQPLIAFKAGRHVADVLTGIGGAIFLFREANALENLKDLPNFANIPDGMGSGSGIWAGIRTRYWCMSYNTNMVKKEDMPKRWEDLLTATRLHDGKMALGRLPQLWVLPLWGAKGKDWTSDYVRKVYSVVKPQRRKEGMDALVSLVVAGEFNAAVASADYRVFQMVQKGAPIAWHCPEPVPVNISEAAVLRNAPNVHAGKMFINWLLSKEGQLAQYHTSYETPVHKALFNKGFSPYPREIEGKPIAFRSPELLLNTEEEMFQLWNPLWNGEKK